ncbi:MAG: exodeoxyribonuclease VII large subunit [Acidimicrobiia bacterium]
MTVLDARQRAIAPAVATASTSRCSSSTRDSTVRALDPRRVLERGYSITRDENGRAVRHAADTATGQFIVTELADGRAASRVEHSPGTAEEAGT